MPAPSEHHAAPGDELSILFVAESALGGTGAVLLQLIPQLKRLGHRVGLVYSERRIDETFSQGVQRLRAQGVETHAVPLHPYKGPGGLVASARELRRRAAEYDLTHLHGVWAGLIGRVALRRGSAVVYSAHGGAFHPRDELPYRIARMLERSVARRTTAFVVSSSYEEDRVRSVIACSASVVLIPHGRDDTPEAGSQPAPSRASRFGIVGRLVPEKRHDLAVDAFATLARQVPDASLVVVGEGPLADELAARVESLGLRTRVDLRGFLTGKTDIYGSMDVLLLPSDSEASPLVITEAQEYGIPAIVSDSGGAALAVDDGSNGLVFPRGDAGALAEAMIALAGDPELFRRCVEGASGAARSRPAWEKVVDQYVELYRNVLGR